LSENELRLERLIPAPPERVFALWTEPAEIVKWWAADRHEIPVSDFDVRPGGKWHATYRTPVGGRRTVSGVYRTVEPPRRLVFSWAWLDDEGRRGQETEVSVTLEPISGGTRLVLLHRNFASAASRERHDQGWSASLDFLVKILG
jgi:uncharacterized protein YndB with AHSA1/START domain